MAPANAWKILAAGKNSGSVVLAVDFDVTGRPEAGFTDLAANLKPDFAIWESVPPLDGIGSSKDYLDHWTQQLEADRTPVHAVMGFCAGSVFAAGLAERIAGWQAQTPTVILFDPEVSTGQTLMWQFTKVMGFMNGVITPDQVAQAREAGAALYDSTPDVGELKDRLIELMRERGEPALIQAGLDEKRRAELFDVFNSFLRYLAAASDIDPLNQWRTAVTYCSKSPLSGLNAMRAAGFSTDEISGGQEIVFDVEHAVMLADPRLAAAVSDQLAL